MHMDWPAIDPLSPTLSDSVKPQLELDDLPAKVACRDVIRQARVTRVKSKGLQALANVSLKKSESGAHRVFKQFGQSCPVKISRIDLPTKKRFPWIKCSDWMKYLADSDRLELLVGVKDITAMGPLLREFRLRYEKIAPQHELFERHRAGQVDISLVVPLLHHGDEGRGYKRLQVMVGSTHGMLGNGCRVTEPSKVKVAGKLDDPMKLNMVGNTWLTHFIHFLVPVALYKDSPESFHTLLEALANDYKMLFYEGCKLHGGQKLWACCVACKGDSPYLAKAGKFERSFYHRPLKAQSRTHGVGVCHMCMAGVESLPNRVEFEEFGASPSWMRTQEHTAPWTDPPAFLEIPREVDNPNGERFFKFDIFHNWHLGAGKYFLSSSIVHVAQYVEEGASLDSRLEKLTCDFNRFCKEKKMVPYYKNLTQEMFGVKKNQQATPSGGWPKGDQTTLFAMWLDDYCRRKIDGKIDERFCVKIVPWVQLQSLNFWND